MADFYAGKILMAKRLITKYGQAITYRQVKDGVPDPTKPWNVGPVTTDYLGVKVAFLPTDRYAFESFGMPAKEDWSVPHGFELGYMAAQEFSPTLKDVILRGTTGVVHSIDNFVEIGPDGRDILYVLLLSK
jgi:hypothetical protein